MGGQILQTGGLRNLLDGSDRLDKVRRDESVQESWRDGALWPTARFMGHSASLSAKLGGDAANKSSCYEIPGQPTATAGFSEVSYLVKKTTQFMFNTNVGGAVATNTTLSSSTLYVSESQTISVPERAERVFHSVRLRVWFRNEQATTAVNFTGTRIVAQLGSVARTYDQVVTVAATASRTWVQNIDFDITDLFEDAFGLSSTQNTLNLQCAVSTSAASQVNGHVFELYVTYGFNPNETVSNNTRCKTIRFPIHSHSTFLTTTQQEIGTDGITPAPSSQIPALNTILPESGKVYKKIWLCLHGNDAGAATNSFTPEISIDGGAATLCANINQQLLCSQEWRHQQDLTATLNPATPHTFSMRCDATTTNKLTWAGGFLCVTYTYDHAATLSGSGLAMYEAIVPLSIADLTSPYTGVPYDAVADASVVGGTGSSAQPFNWQHLIMQLDIQEPGPVTMVQSGACCYESVSSSSGISVKRAGVQPPRTWSPGVASLGTVLVVQRLDIGSSGITLNRGINRIPFDIYGVGRTLQVGSYAIINYTAGISVDADKGNHPVYFHARGLDSAQTVNSVELTREGVLHPPVIAPPYKFSGVLFEAVFSTAGNIGLNLALEQLPGEFDSNGWGLVAQTASQLVSNTAPNWIGVTGLYNRTHFGGTRFDPVAKRRTIMSTQSSLNASWGIWYTYHQITFPVAGLLNIAGLPAPAGKVIEIYARDTTDPLNPTQLVTVTTTDATGHFSVNVMDNTRSYFASYSEGSVASRSPTATPGATFNITTTGGGGDTTPPVITIVTPTPGQPITRQTVITVDVTDTIAMRRVILYAVFSKPNAWEVIYDGESFGPAYSGPNNTVTTITGGWEFRVLRDGGWQQTPVLRVIAVDAAGNIA